MVEHHARRHDPGKAAKDRHGHADPVASAAEGRTGRGAPEGADHPYQRDQERTEAGRFRDWVQAFANENSGSLVPHGLRKNAVNGLLKAECSTAKVSSITGQSLQIVEQYAKQRNQARMATAAVLKWGRHEPGTGKL